MTEQLRFDPDTLGDLDSYTLDFGDWLATIPGDTITSALVTVTPAGMTLHGAATIAGGLVTQSLSGGSLGTDYTIVFEVSTANGRIVSRSAMLHCGPPEPDEPTPVSRLGARALRRIGVTIVADADRPAAGAAQSAAQIADDMLRQMGIVTAEAARPGVGTPVSQQDIAARALRALGVNPSPGPWPQPAPTYTAAAVAALTLTRMGIPFASQADTEVTTQTDIAALALREIGVNPLPAPWSAAAAPVSSDDVARTVMLRLGIPVDIANQPPAGPPVSLTYIAQLALEAVGVNPATLTLGIDSGTVFGLADVATAALVRLTVIAPDETPSALDQLDAVAAARSVHDLLAATDFVTWDATHIPDAAFQFYVVMVASIIGPGHGKPSTLEGFQTAQALVRQLALSGKHAQDLAISRVTAIHEELNDLGLVSWGAGAVPAGVSEHYVRMAEIRLAPIYRTMTPEQMAADEASYEKTIAAVRRSGMLSGVQSRAGERVATVHAELAALGLATWSAAAIPASLTDIYATLATSMMTAEGGKPLTLAEYDAQIAALRSVILSGPLGQSLAEAAVDVVHAELNALGLVSWALTAVPASEKERYAQLAGSRLRRTYAPMAADEATARAALDTAVMGAIQRTGLLVGVQARAAARVATVHSELVARGFVTWTVDQIPASLVDPYALLTESLLTAEGGKPMTLAEHAARVEEIRVIVLSGQLGQTLAEAMVSAVHEELNGLSLVSWPLSTVPEGCADYYAQLAKTKLWPIYRGETTEDRKANAEGDAVVMGALRRTALVAGATARAVNRVGVVHDELNALGLVSWPLAAIPNSASDCYMAMASSKMEAEGGKALTLAEYAGWQQRVRMIAMGGPAGQALAEQKVRAVHYSWEARGKARWTLFDIPDFAEEPYVLMAATLLAPECGMKADPNWWRAGEMDLLRIIQIPSDHGPVIANYF